MVKVYFETPNNSYCEEVATFDTEELYMLCLPVLEKEAKKRNMIVTESTENDKIGWIDINKEKPEVGQPVLINLKKEPTTIVISKFEIDDEYGEFWRDSDDNAFEINTVKSWMKLPDSK